MKNFSHLILNTTVSIGALCLVSSSCQSSRTDNGQTLQQHQVDLKVAVFEFLPDGSSAIKRLEAAFELAHPMIDLDLELFDPYGDDNLSKITQFDLVEVDLCRIDELIAGKFGGLDKLPSSTRNDANDYVEPARTIAKTKIGEYVVPHWVCGNFLMFWSDNAALAKAKSFNALLAAMNPNTGRPLEADLFGSTTLGEYYADALLDRLGPEKTRQHLLALAQDGIDTLLDSEAEQAVVKLSRELRPDARKNLSYFHNVPQIYPRQFASSRSSALIGYSERLYYVERERQLIPGYDPPNLKKADLVVRAFSFADSSRGTPYWIDGFTIPRGKLKSKKSEIKAFLDFIRTKEGYLAFAQPAEWGAPSYLLPAASIGYEGDLAIKQPLLAKFRDQLNASFPVTESQVWRGIQKAGSKLKGRLSRN